MRKFTEMLEGLYQHLTMSNIVIEALDSSSLDYLLASFCTLIHYMSICTWNI